jgi:NAD(P)-dependent dehydrogenase (short-subunit alcohol dehydrogenase family)
MRPPLRRPGRLDGRTCLIVGGTGGIGLASARRFLEEGARVVVAGQSPEIGRSAMAQLAPLGPVWESTFELASGAPEVARLFTFALDALGGRIDVMLHVAGISGRKFGDGPLHECTDGGWDRVMEINASGVFLTNRAAVRFMMRQPVDPFGLRGTVVNVGSVLDRAPAPEQFGTIAYAASKGAIRSLTLAAAAAYAPDRIRFNLLVPGLIDTPMAARAVNDPRIQPYIAARQPIAGGPGSAEDVAEAALYLCEPSSRFVTGAELVVDGGWCVSEGVTRGTGFQPVSG